MDDSDYLFTQYFKSPCIPQSSAICYAISLPDEADIKVAMLQDLPGTVYAMAKYQIEVKFMADRAGEGVDPVYFVRFLRQRETMRRDELKDTISLLDRVNRALCIIALDSLIRTMEGYR